MYWKAQSVLDSIERIGSYWNVLGCIECLCHAVGCIASCYIYKVIIHDVFGGGLVYQIAAYHVSDSSVPCIGWQFACIC